MLPRDLVYVGHMLDMARKAVAKVQDLLQRLHLRRRIRLQLRAQRRCLLPERQRLERSFLESVRDAARAIDVHAAQRDHASRMPAKDVHQLACLPSGTQHHVDDDVRCKRAKGICRFGQPPAIADNLSCARRHCCPPPMKHSDVVVAMNQLAGDMRADETRSADNQYVHLHTQIDRFEPRPREWTRRQDVFSFSTHSSRATTRLFDSQRHQWFHPRRPPRGVERRDQTRRDDDDGPGRKRGHVERIHHHEGGRQRRR